MSTNSLLIVLGIASLVLYAIYALRRKRLESSVKDKLKPFLAAFLHYRQGPGYLVYRPGGEPDDEAGLLRFYAKRLSKCPNPYVAATEEWINGMGHICDGYASLRKGVGEAYFGPGVVPPPRQKRVPEPITDSEIFELIEVLRFDVICDFVLEGQIIREEGERYFGQLAKMLKKVLVEQKVDAEKAPSFATFLEERRVQRSTENPT